MAKNPSKQTNDQLAPDSDEHFASIAGYTEGDIPYGVTWEEREALGRADAVWQDGHPGEEKL